MPLAEIRFQQTESAIATPTVALIADHATPNTIVATLEAESVQTATFERAEDVPADDDADAPAAVVLWAEDSSPSSLARLLRPLTRRFGQTPLVVICAGAQRWGIRSALSAGAAGVVLYEQLDVALGACLQAVLAGQVCVPQAHARQLEPPVLSSREKQILGLVVMGYMNSQIAERLYLAESTVKSHLSSAFGKLGVRSRNEAVNLILDPERGWGMGILALGGEPVT